jgi:integrase
VAHIRAVLRRALGQAMAWGTMVPRNVAALAKPPRSAHKPVQPLSAEQVRLFLDATKDDRIGPLFHVAIASGLRQGEFFGLRWQDVDLSTGVLTVRYAMQRVDKKPTLDAEVSSDDHTADLVRHRARSATRSPDV